MKKICSIIVSVLSAVIFAISASAEQDVNLMKDYRDPLWEGDTLYYEEYYGTISFNGESGMASVVFPTEDSLGFWFYFDMGNLSGKGTGYGSVEFLDEDGNVIEACTTEKNIGNGSFNRYQLGSEEEYAPIPEEAESVRVSIAYEGGEQSPYFRNFCLVLSDSIAVSDERSEWDISGKLQIVQVGVTRTDHIVWIVFVALVAFAMLLTRKLMDRAKKLK